jgi:dipeptidyl aminopeptidase/acylaminoacyl peptidase
MKKTLLFILLFVSAANAQRPMTARDLWSLGRVGNPVLSPDGSQVAYTVTRYDLDTFKSKTEIWSVPTAGGAPRLLASPGSQPSWSPAGQLAYTRGGQLYIGDKQVTNVANGVGGPLVWSRDGRKILFSSSVAEGPNPTREKSQARVYDELMYRHWDEWEDENRNHVLVLDVATGQTKDVTPGPFDTPPIALEGFQDYDISPDGSEIAFVRNTSVPTMVGTGNDIWVVSANGGEPRLLTQSKANDISPLYSPDGRYIAYLAMQRAGFEADRTELILYDRSTQQRRSLTSPLDLSVDNFAWAADSKSIYFLAGDQINHSVFRVALNGAPVRITEGSYNSGLAVSRDGKTIVVAQQAVERPVELFVLDAKGRTLRQLTHVNDDLLKQLALQPAESFWFTGAEGAKVQGFIVKPPNFDASKKYPVVYLIHGGPQGVWANSWSYRWNPNMFAAPGYVVVAVNPRGSTGYGQKFTDEISGDWGGKAYTDLMNGIDYALATYPFADKDRVAAAGASYGGYMINWINGHTNRFKALINHDGIFNTMSMYGSTEELWFPEWEFGGLPWEKPELYEKWNPARFAQNMRTPTLVVHGGLDYRVPLEQGLMTFTALRRQGVPARFLYFPDEGHWVLKPQNAFVWWDNMLGWLNTYLTSASSARPGAGQ